MTIRIGTASPNTQPTTPLTLNLLSQFAHHASIKQIDLLLLPEAFIGGYPRGSSFGCVIGNRTAEGREEFARYFEQAIDLGDTVGDGGAGAGDRWAKKQLDGYEEGGKGRGDGSREELERIARETGVFIVTGCVEKAGGSLYCAVVYVCPQEGIIGKRRKVMPTGCERLIWAQGHPSTLRAVTTTIRHQRINLAAAICWENYMPLVRQTLYAQNINLYLAPTADARDTWLGLMRTVGIEGRCFVVSSNMCAKGEDAALGDITMDGSGGRLTGRERPRRNSTITEDGFEIALPPSPTSRTKQHKRRKSIFDEDGNEIVLSCPPDNDVNGTTTNATTSIAVSTASVTDAAETKPVYLSRGGSSIVSPFGDVIAGPQWEDDEGIIFADIDLRDCVRGRLDIDTAGSYSRNDAFKFSVQGLELDPLPY